MLDRKELEKMNVYALTHSIDIRTKQDEELVQEILDQKRSIGILEDMTGAMRLVDTDSIGKPGGTTEAEAQKVIDLRVKTARDRFKKHPKEEEPTQEVTETNHGNTPTKT